MSKTSAMQAAPATRPPMERLQWWDRELRAGKYPTLAQCCRHFEVSERTARRDLDFLRYRLDAPCEYDRKHHGYYYTEPGFSLPSMRLSEGEVLVLFVAESLLEQYQGTPYAGQIRQTFEKLRQALPDEVSIETNSLRGQLSFDLGAQRKVDEQIFSSLTEAIRQRRQVRLVYHAASNNQDTERQVDPLHLHAAGGDWYLIAFCHLRGEIREFALSRIQTLAQTDLRFTPPADFNQEQWLRDSFGVVKGGTPQEVILDFDDFAARWVREREWHHSQRIEPLAGGGLRLRLAVSLTPDLIAWIFAYGPHCTVADPPELRDQIREQVRAMQQIYF